MEPTTPSGKAAQDEYLRQKRRVEGELDIDWDLVAGEAVAVARESEHQDIWARIDALAVRVLDTQRDIEDAKLKR